MLASTLRVNKVLTELWLSDQGTWYEFNRGDIERVKLRADGDPRRVIILQKRLIFKACMVLPRGREWRPTVWKAEFLEQSVQFLLLRRILVFHIHRDGRPRVPRQSSENREARGRVAQNSVK